MTIFLNCFLQAEMLACPHSVVTSQKWRPWWQRKLNSLGLCSLLLKSNQMPVFPWIKSIFSIIFFKNVATAAGCVIHLAFWLSQYLVGTQCPRTERASQAPQAPQAPVIGPSALCSLDTEEECVGEDRQLNQCGPTWMVESKLCLCRSCQRTCSCWP